jgi:lactoylglutathione lyase
MGAQSAFPMISVESLDRSLAFYVGELGGTIGYRFPTDAPEFVVVGLGSSSVGLGVAATRSLHGRPTRPARGIEMCVYVDDVDATVASMGRSGTEVVVDPVDQAWGERVAYVSDPDGVLVMLVAPLTPDSGGTST